ncbi:hypothetical protein IOD16_24710 [Saccharothrix sp. 6-C]|uniref:hypothetical protein n=1 Tax=Saccharothrix sp. 6-C TaxID=2781735 RepID=UPI0019175729|nr:hypothetical protein [Saccharothrix sp. 6-C]QQQ74373.1 hypothetical protein IOD16_24710 [Saccharothrix sp. 6-C]
MNVLDGSASRPRRLRIGFNLDVVGYSTRSWQLRKMAQRRVSELTDDVIAHLGIDRAAVDRQGTGDGVLAFLAAELEPSWVLPRLLRTCQELLHADNKLYTDRIRLRMAVTMGSIAPSEPGFAGEPATELSRLIDSDAARAAVVRHEDRDLVAVVSDILHSLAVDPSDDTYARCRDRGEGNPGNGWLWIGRPPA